MSDGCSFSRWGNIQMSEMTVWQNHKEFTLEGPTQIKKCFSSVRISNWSFTKRGTDSGFQYKCFWIWSVWICYWLQCYLWIHFYSFPNSGRPNRGVASQQIVSSSNAKKFWMLRQFLPRPRFNAGGSSIYGKEIYMHISSLHKSDSFLKNSCELHRPRIAVIHRGLKIYYLIL